MPANRRLVLVSILILFVVILASIAFIGLPSPGDLPAPQAVAREEASTESVATPPHSDAIQLVAVQMSFNLDDFWSREAFEAKIRGLMEQVAGETEPGLPTLVVFPEDVGLMLIAQGMRDRLGEVESIAEAIERAVKAHLVPLALTKWRRKLSWVPALYLYKQRAIAETYFDVFSTMAREYGVYLVAGSAVLPPYRIEEGVVRWQEGPVEQRVYNTSYLFGPDGSVIGKQEKVHLIELEREAALDLASGALESLQVFDTPLGKVGIAICLDAFEEDVIDRLVAQGAQILVQPSANPGPWSVEQQIDWLRSSHQKSFVEGRFEYAVNPMMNGPLWEIAFFGQSSIVAKNPDAVDEAYAGGQRGYVDLSPSPGFIRVATSDRSEEVLVAKVPHPALR